MEFFNLPRLLFLFVTNSKEFKSHFLLFFFLEMNPLDYIYKAIGCHIKLMSENEFETQYILKYIYSTGKFCFFYFGF